MLNTRMTINTDYVKRRTKRLFSHDRESLAADVEKYLAEGGQIQDCGTCGNAPHKRCYAIGRGNQREFF